MHQQQPCGSWRRLAEKETLDQCWHAVDNYAVLANDPVRRAAAASQGTLRLIGTGTGAGNSTALIHFQCFTHQRVVQPPLLRVPQRLIGFGHLLELLGGLGVTLRTAASIDYAVREPPPPPPLLRSIKRIFHPWLFPPPPQHTLFVSGWYFFASL